MMDIHSKNPAPDGHCARVSSRRVQQQYWLPRVRMHWRTNSSHGVDPVCVSHQFQTYVSIWRVTPREMRWNSPTALTNYLHWSIKVSSSGAVLFVPRDPAGIISDPIWRHRSESMLAHVTPRCLTAPNHYLNQCWHDINGTLWYSS